MTERTPRLRDDTALVDTLTDFLYDECNMGGASTYHTKRILDVIEEWPRRGEGCADPTCLGVRCGFSPPGADQ